MLGNYFWDHIFASGHLVGPRLTGSFPADLVAADQREIEDGLREGRPRSNDVKGTSVLTGPVLDTLKIVLID
jgi:hypothetical protein